MDAISIHLEINSWETRENPSKRYQFGSGALNLPLNVNIEMCIIIQMVWPQWSERNAVRMAINKDFYNWTTRDFNWNKHINNYTRRIRWMNQMPIWKKHELPTKCSNCCESFFLSRVRVSFLSCDHR